MLFLSFDIPFLAANLFKFFDGGYVPMLIGAALIGRFLRWAGARYRAALDREVREVIEAGGVTPERAKRARASRSGPCPTSTCTARKAAPSRAAAAATTSASWAEPGRNR